MRCFKNFSLDNIAPITLISGRNNIGKTTLLECIYLSCRFFLPNIFIELNVNRGNNNINLNPIILWEQLFYNIDLSNPLTLDSTLTYGKNYLKFYKDVNLSIEKTVTNIYNTDSLVIPSTELFYPLNIVNTSGKNKFKANFIIQNNGLALKTKGGKIANIQKIYYLTAYSNIDMNNIIELLSKIELKLKKQELIDILKTIDHKINNIVIVNIHNLANIFCTTIDGINIHISNFGKGFFKLLILIAFLLENPDSIVLIDEIENGFHYSFLPILWEILYNLSIKYNSQIIATTHSYECIEKAFNFFKNTDEGFFSYIKLSKDNSEIKSHVFTKNLLENAIKLDFEVR
jgi:AAA15 family ATPase/GTPase